MSTVLICYITLILGAAPIRGVGALNDLLY